MRCAPVLLLVAALATPAISGRGAAPQAAPTSRPKSQPATAPAPATLKVATYNILYLNKDLKGIVRSIRKSGADVVCLQETNRKSAAFLRRELKKPYPHTRFRNGFRAGGFGFLSRRPLTHVRYLRPRFGPFGSHYCRVKLGGKDVQIVNVHLVATLPVTRDPRQWLRIWIFTEALRARQIARICKDLPADMPVVIAGDLNSMPAWNAPQFLKDKGYVDSLASARRDHAEVVTWTGKVKGVTLSLRLDYIFHNRRLKTLDSRVLPSNASDHHLLVSTVALAPKGAPTSRPAPSSQPAARR